eukprot:60479_1
MRSRSGTGGGGSFGVQMNGTWTDWGTDRWGLAGTRLQTLEFEEGEWVNKIQIAYNDPKIFIKFHTNKGHTLNVGNTNLERRLETQSGTQLAGLFFKSGGWLDGGRFVWRISAAFNTTEEEMVATDVVNTEEETIADRRLTLRRRL